MLEKLFFQGKRNLLFSCSRLLLKRRTTLVINIAIGNTDNFMMSFAGQCSKPVPFKGFQMFCRPLLAAVHLALVVSTPRLWFMDVSKKASPL